MNYCQNADESLLQNKINSTLDSFTKYLREIYTNTNKLGIEIGDKNIRQINLLQKIENIIHNVTNDIINLRPPFLILPTKLSWNNCVFGDRLNLISGENCEKSVIRLCDRKSTNKFAVILFLLGKIFVLIKKQEVLTKRELYYQNVELLKSQSVVDNALNTISCILSTNLHDLNIYATSKGLIYGPIFFKISDEEIDCSKFNGTLIPDNIFDTTEIKTDAKFILLLEKDAIFQKLLDDNAMKNLPPCIFITGKGFPDINTRILLKKFWDILQIPILALVDPDPYGIEILCVYRFGSLTLCHQNDNLAVPSIRWLGIFPSELQKLCDSPLNLTNSDKIKLNDLLKRPYVRNTEKLQTEIEYMINFGFKAEIEDFEITSGHLSHKYIPFKLSIGDFL